MKDKKFPAESATPQNSQGIDFASRRTVVKGVASMVPVVMTLGNGAALANSSSCDPLAMPGAFQERPTGVAEKGWSAEFEKTYDDSYSSLDSASVFEPVGIVEKGMPVNYISANETPTDSPSVMSASAGCSLG